MTSVDASKGSIKHSEVRAKIPKLHPFNARSENMNVYLKNICMVG